MAQQRKQLDYLNEVERKNKEKIMFLSGQAEQWMNDQDTIQQGVTLPWVITIVVASAFLGLIVGLSVFCICKQR